MASEYFFESLKAVSLVSVRKLFGRAVESVAKSEMDTPIDFPKHLIFVSPHHDDIVLTFNGLIENNSGFVGHCVEALTIFSLSSYTVDHPVGDLSKERIDRISKIRFMEEEAAMNSLFNHRARMETYDYPDAPIRGYEAPNTAPWGLHGNFSTFRYQEFVIFEKLVTLFEEKLRIADSAMFIPMANGSHIDHFITREAVIAGARNLGKKSACKIFFGTDQPYTGVRPEESIKEMATLERRLKLKRITYPIDHSNKIARFAKHYVSQYNQHYMDGIEQWARVNDCKEDIYYWDRKDYADAKQDASVREI